MATAVGLAVFRLRVLIEGKVWMFGVAVGLAAVVDVIWALGLVH